MVTFVNKIINYVNFIEKIYVLYHTLSLMRKFIRIIFNILLDSPLQFFLQLKTYIIIVKQNVLAVPIYATR